LVNPQDWKHTDEMSTDVNRMLIPVQMTSDCYVAEVDNE